MTAATDDYGRAPDYAGTTPGNPRLRAKLFGRVLVPRPVHDPATLPAFVTDQPQE